MVQSLLAEYETPKENRTKQKYFNNFDKRSIAVLPYVHKGSRNLQKKKKVVTKSGITLFFSAPNKLQNLCRLVNQGKKEPLIHVRKQKNAHESMSYAVANMST